MSMTGLPESLPGHARSLRILGIGGSLRQPSHSAAALRLALGAAKPYADTHLLLAADLLFPFFSPRTPFDDLPPEVVRMLTLVRQADGLVLSTPTYHGAMSGLVKNALDYVEHLRGDARPYLGRKPVGVITLGSGVTSVVRAFDGLVHTIQALRGTPLQPLAPLVLADQFFDADGRCTDPATERRIGAVAEEVLKFLLRPPAASLADPASPISV